jgi:hypothetical protein
MNQLPLMMESKERRDNLSLSKTVLAMKENGMKILINGTGEDTKFGRMVPCMKVTGKMTKQMDADA